ncbi:hypothetical protein Tco_1163029 [Tanacetum coccineum]
MHKHDKNQVVNLLQPVSNEFEPNGYYPIYGMTSSAKKGPGHGFRGESEKNDYNIKLKTPTATPLFPSLEMEKKNAHELVVQRELSIIQPLSRMPGILEVMVLWKPSTYILRVISRRCCIPELILRCMQVYVSLMESGLFNQNQLQEFLLFEREYCIWKMELLDESAE